MKAHSRFSIARTRKIAMSVTAFIMLCASGTLIAVPSAAADTTQPEGQAIPNSQYTLVDFDSQSDPYPAPPSLDGTAAGAFDGDYTTQWASYYNNGDPDPMPHHLTFDTGAVHTLTGLGYSVKVQDNGPAQNVEVLTTTDPAVADDSSSDQWVSAGTATFSQPESNTQIQYVTFDRPVDARWVQFKVISAVNDSNNASASELVVYTTDTITDMPAGKAITNAQYTLIDEDSEQNSSGDGSASSAFDQDYSTQWASEYSPDSVEYPHWITFDVGGSFTLTGLGYSVKVQSNGPVKDVCVYTTDDETVANDSGSSQWQTAGTATFVQPKANSDVQYVVFSNPVTARYVRFEAQNAINGSNNASASEIVVFSTDTDTAPEEPEPSDSPYTVTTDSVETDGWNHPDDTSASTFIDKDGTFHFEQAHALYGQTDSRKWSFFTGTTIDDATLDSSISDSGNNPDTTTFCNEQSPTGVESTRAENSGSYSEPNYCDITQMWVDPDTGDWYGLVHNEFTPQPFGDGLHYDSIDYAVSHDQGKTWSIPGHAITSPYSTLRNDTEVFPESTYYYGDGDPRLYVDYASGYFYAFYGSRVVNKNGGWVAFYEHVARAPISDKMATGSWQKWYDGQWEQPGIGGKESNMTPVTDEDSQGYTDPVDEYDPTTPGSAQQQIRNGQMPATSPLFVMDVTYNAYLGLYIAEPQNPDQSGDAPQEYYATDNLATQRWFKLGDTGDAYGTASWYRWFIDSTNKTSSAIVGKSFRSYCSFGCMNGSSSEYVNVTIDSETPALVVDTTKTYTIASGSSTYLAASPDGSMLTSVSEANNENAAWDFHPTGDGAYTITDHDGALLGVDSSEPSSRAWDGALTLLAADETVGQQWFVIRDTDASTGDPTGTVRLVNRYSQLVLALSDSQAVMTPERTWDKDGDDASASSTVTAQTLTLAQVPDGINHEALIGPDRGLRWEMAFNAKTLVDPFWTDTAPGLDANLERVKAAWGQDDEDLSETQLYIYLSDYATGNQTLPDSTLDNIRSLFQGYRDHGMHVVLRFALDDDVEYKQMPYTVQDITGLIEQVAPIVDEYSDVVTIWQAGFVGAWGEWGGNYYNHQNWPDATWSIMKTLLENLPDGIDTQMRYPWLRNTVIEQCDADATVSEEQCDEWANRIGLHNDYFTPGLNGESGGDDTMDPTSTYLSSKGIAYADVRNAALSTSVDGEMPWDEVQSPGDPYWTWKVPVPAENAATRMQAQGYTTFSLAHNYILTYPVWKSTTWSLEDVEQMRLPAEPDYFTNESGEAVERTQFEYIRDHLGYRLALKGLDTTVGEDSVDVALSLQNFGFAAPLKDYSVTVSLLDASGQLVASQDLTDVNTSTWKGCGSVELTDQACEPPTYELEASLPVETLPDGTYQLALTIGDSSAVRGSVQLANSTVSFDNGSNILTDVSIERTSPEPDKVETTLSDVTVWDVTSSSAKVSATLTAAGLPVSGALVAFYDGDSKLGEALTDASGVAAATLGGLDAASEYAVVAKYAGDDTHEASASASAVTFTTEEPVESGQSASDTLVARRGNRFYFKYSLSGGDADTVVAYGRPGDQALVGDWDGDGVDTLAVRRGNRFYIKNSLEGGDADTVVAYGRPGDQVLVGDWDGDGKDTLAVRRGKTYHFRDSLSGGAADTVVAYGRSSDQVLAGDWDGDGVDTLAVRRGKTYHFKNSLSGGQADTVIAYGKAYDQVLAGDWDSDGEDTLAVRRGKTYHFKDSLSGGQADKVIAYGGLYDQAFAGKWR